MLAILLTILKIIGWLLLGILCLLLSVLLLVLCVPVRYRMNGSYYDELKGQAKITWLLHILSVSVVYDKRPFFTVRIFGIPIRERKRKRRRVKHKTKANEDGMETDILMPEDEILTVQSLPAEEAAEDKTPPQLPPPDQTPPPVTEDIKQKKKTSGKKKNNPGNLYKKITFFFSNIRDKIKDINLNIQMVKGWIQDEENKKLIKLMLRQIKFLFRHILPRQARGKIVFGFDDPYTTGQVLSYVGIFYPLCHKQLSVYPVFDRAVFEGEGLLKGHIRVGTLLLPAVRLLCNKRFRFLLKKFLR